MKLFLFFTLCLFISCTFAKTNTKHEKNIDNEDLYASIKDMIISNEVMVFSKSYCPFCKKAKNLLNEYGISFTAFELDVEKNGADVHEVLKSITRQRTVPNIFIGGQHVGGFDALSSMTKDKIQSMLDTYRGKK